MKIHARRFIGTLALLACLPPALAQDAASPPALVVIDLRPAEERDGNGVLPLAGKCNKDVYRIADVATDPLKVDLLKQELARMMIEGAASKTLTVLDWSIYYNKQVQKSGGLFDGVGIQGYTIPGKKKEKKGGSACSQKESAGGWYQAGELTSVYFPLISEFMGTLGGKPLTVRIVYSPQRKLPGKFVGDKDDTAALLDTIEKTAEALAASINQ